MKAILLSLALLLLATLATALFPAQTTVVKNWNEQDNCVPKWVFRPSSLAELQAIVADAKADNIPVKVVGAAHSFSGIYQTNGYLVEMFNLNATQVIDPVQRIVRAQAGIMLSELDVFLTANNMAIPSSTLIHEITLGGAIASGSHGTGKKYGILADFVVQLRILDANSILRTYTGVQLRKVAVSLGVFGIIYDMDLKVEPHYNVHILAQTMPYSDITNPSILRNLHQNSDSLDIYIPPFSPNGQVRQTFDYSPNPSDFDFDEYVAAGDATVAATLAAAPFFAANPAVLYALGTSGGLAIFPDVNITWPVEYSIHYSYKLERGPNRLKTPEMVFKFNNNPAGFTKVTNIMKFLYDSLVNFYNTTGQAPVIFGWGYRITATSKHEASPCAGNEDLCLWVDIIVAVDAAGITDFLRQTFDTLTVAPFNGQYHFAKGFEKLPSVQYKRLKALKKHRNALNVDPSNIFVNELIARLFLNADSY